MTIGFSTALRTARLQQVVALLDAGSGANATVLFYGGGSGRPATGAAITDQTLVATVGLSKPSGTVSGGVLTFDTFSDDISADADEDIEWARFLNTDDEFVIDMGCGSTAVPAGNEIIFNTLTARIGGVVQVVSGSLTEGNL